MTKNWPLLNAVMRQILDHPETHNQDVWLKQTACGTTACAAGWATQLAGLRPIPAAVWMKKGLDDYNGAPTPVIQEQLDLVAVDWNEHGYATVSEAARRLLGLDYEESAKFFHHSNSRKQLLDEVWWWSAELVSEARAEDALRGLTAPELVDA